MLKCSGTSCKEGPTKNMEATEPVADCERARSQSMCTACTAQVWPDYTRALAAVVQLPHAHQQRSVECSTVACYDTLHTMSPFIKLVTVHSRSPVHGVKLSCHLDKGWPHGWHRSPAPAHQCLHAYPIHDRSSRCIGTVQESHLLSTSLKGAPRSEHIGCLTVSTAINVQSFEVACLQGGGRVVWNIWAQATCHDSNSSRESRLAWVWHLKTDVWLIMHPTKDHKGIQHSSLRPDSLTDSTCRQRTAVLSAAHLPVRCGSV